jgi:hypothetical protein
VLPDSSYTVAPQSLADAVILDDDAASAALTGFLLI